MLTPVKPAINVLGQALQTCGNDPLTGFFRDGCCNTSPADMGSHTVCVQVTEAFLVFSAQQGNDLSTPMPAYNFPGLMPGDKWCLCAPRWQEALEANVAPPVYLDATHQGALEHVSLSDLEKHAIYDL
jgi:uncharacterized protein